MRKTIIICIIYAILLYIVWITARDVDAKELYRAEATAYCLTGTTATGTQTTAGRTVASKREWFGRVMAIWIDDGDGLIKFENFLGFYTVEDTGSEAIASGKVLDLYIPDYQECRKFGRKKVIFQLIESEG